MRDTGAISAVASGTEPAEPVRFAAFARFFKAYMGTAAVVTASLPLPVAAFHLIPTYAAQEKFLSTYTSLFCFLLLAYLFYIRHWLGRLMFYTKPDGDVTLRRVRLAGSLAVDIGIPRSGLPLPSLSVSIHSPYFRKLA